MTRDDRFSDAFDDVRRADSAAVPDFEVVLSDARRGLRRRRARRVGGAVLAAAALAIVAGGVLERENPSDGLGERLLAGSALYRGPTSFLLDSRPDPLWRRSPATIYVAPRPDASRTDPAGSPEPVNPPPRDRG